MPGAVVGFAWGFIDGFVCGFLPGRPVACDPRPPPGLIEPLEREGQSGGGGGPCVAQPVRFVCTREPVENGEEIHARLTVDMASRYRFTETSEHQFPGAARESAVEPRQQGPPVEGDLAVNGNVNITNGGNLGAHVELKGTGTGISFLLDTVCSGIKYAYAICARVE